MFRVAEGLDYGIVGCNDPLPTGAQLPFGGMKESGLGRENGVEGKCAVCGQYVVKGGVKFRAKSVLCPECAERQARIGDPYQRAAGRRRQSNDGTVSVRRAAARDEANELIALVD